MMKYIVTIQQEQRFDAGPKARRDAERIALVNGYIALPFVGGNTANGNALGMLSMAISSLRNVFTLFRVARKGDLVLFQYPHYPVKSSLILRWAMPVLQKCRGIRFAALVHDLNSVRGLMGWANRYSDQHWLQHFDAVICHNASMKRYLEEKLLVPDHRLICLNIFDYLTEAIPAQRPAFEKSVAIAGNLAKSEYLRPFVASLPADTLVHLFGNGWTGEDETSNAQWHGAFPPDELPASMKGAFGLVWDGPETTTCSGAFGDYLRINAPHKLSLYLASGLPVIIWNEAAQARYVEENNVGITVSSLEEIPEKLTALTPESYDLMAANAADIGANLRQGTSLTAALAKAESLINIQP